MYPMTRSEAPSASIMGPHWSHTLSEADVTNSTYSTKVVSCSALMVPCSAIAPPTTRVATCGRHSLVQGLGFWGLGLG